MHVMEEKAMIMFSKASHGESKWVTILPWFWCCL